MSTLNYVMRLISAGLGLLWCSLEPTMPWALVCIFAVIVDCISAARLNRRVKERYPNGGAEGKFQSRHAMKIFRTLFMVYSCIILAYWVDQVILPHITMHLGEYVAAAFCLTTITSILENESSCNDASWARLLQKVLADKTKRHLDIDLGEITKPQNIEKQTTEHTEDTEK